jgi:hypothetical protein
MENEPNESPETGGKPAGRRSRRRTPRAAATGLDPALLQAFKEIPLSREGMVERARQLLRDPDYPSDRTIWLISEILATHLEFDGYSF